MDFIQDNSNNNDYTDFVDLLDHYAGNQEMQDYIVEHTDLFCKVINTCNQKRFYSNIEMYAKNIYNYLDDKFDL